MLLQLIQESVTDANVFHFAVRVNPSVMHLLLFRR